MVQRRGRKPKSKEPESIDSHEEGNSFYDGLNEGIQSFHTFFTNKWNEYNSPQNEAESNSGDVRDAGDDEQPSRGQREHERQRSQEHRDDICERSFDNQKDPFLEDLAAKVHAVDNQKRDAAPGMSQTTQARPSILKKTKQPKPFFEKEAESVIPHREQSIVKRRLIRAKSDLDYGSSISSIQKRKVDQDHGQRISEIRSSSAHPRYIERNRKARSRSGSFDPIKIQGSPSRRRTKSFDLQRSHTMRTQSSRSVQATKGSTRSRSFDPKEARIKKSRSRSFDPLVVKKKHTRAKSISTKIQVVEPMPKARSFVLRRSGENLGRAKQQTRTYTLKCAKDSSGKHKPESHTFVLSPKKEPSARGRSSRPSNKRKTKTSTLQSKSPGSKLRSKSPKSWGFFGRKRTEKKKEPVEIKITLEFP